MKVKLHKLHKLANPFPKIDGDEFKTLVLDIKKNGLHQSITLLDGKILDGANRYRACISAGVEPVFETFHGEHPEAFVISQNLNRRHLSTSQRAAIAAELVTTTVGRNAKETNSSINVSEAAKRLKVSETSVKDAGAVKEKSPKTFDDVKSGRLSLNAATRQTRTRNPKPKREPKPEEAPRVKPEPVTVKKSLSLGPPLTPGEFKEQLDLLEDLIPEDGNHEKYGTLLNAAANRQMNWGKSNNAFAYA